MKNSQDIVEAAVARMAPVIEEAGKFITDSKFMFVMRAGKMFPVKCAINDPTLKEQIKAAMSDTVTGAAGDLVPEMPEIEIAG